MRILVIDIGGSHVKMLATDQRTPRRFDSGPTLTPRQMMRGILEATSDWRFDRVTIGYPGPTRNNHPLMQAAHLGPGWVGFDFAKAFGKPVRLLNDAAMQALGGYQRGRMLFLGLGTGLGSALVVEGHLQPLELAHLPYRKEKSFEDFVGERGRKRLGEARWAKRVIEVVELLKGATQVDSVLLGGGNARRLEGMLKQLPPGTRLGSNADAFKGGFRLWDAPESIARERKR